jgi:hypothetical protein
VATDRKEAHERAEHRKEMKAAKAAETFESVAAERVKELEAIRQRTADSGQRTADSGQRTADSGTEKAEARKRKAWSSAQEAEPCPCRQIRDKRNIR